MELHDSRCTGANFSEWEHELCSAKQAISRLNTELRQAQIANVKLTSEFERTRRHNSEILHRVQLYEDTSAQLRKENVELKEGHQRLQSVILGLREKLHFLSRDRDFIENLPPKRKQSLVRIDQESAGNFGNEHFQLTSQNSTESNQIGAISTSLSRRNLLNYNEKFKCTETAREGVFPEYFSNQPALSQLSHSAIPTFSSRSPRMMADISAKKTLESSHYITAMEVCDSSQSDQPRRHSGFCIPRIHIEDWSEIQPRGRETFDNPTPPSGTQSLKNFEFLCACNRHTCPHMILKECGPMCETV